MTIVKLWTHILSFLLCGSLRFLALETTTTNQRNKLSALKYIGTWGHFRKSYYYYYYYYYYHYYYY